MQGSPGLLDRPCAAYNRAVTSKTSELTPLNILSVRAIENSCYDCSTSAI